MSLLDEFVIFIDITDLDNQLYSIIGEIFTGILLIVQDIRKNAINIV